jgi:hypothetical protein
MATRGAKPKPDHLRLVDGTRNVTRHGKEADIRQRVESSTNAFGKPERPAYLKGQAAWAWKRYIEPAAWLDASREGIAIAFCELWEEFRFNPKGFPASKHGQMRSYLSELGLTDERNRKVSDDGKAKDEFFDD